jgi:hypothetical protein
MEEDETTPNSLPPWVELEYAARKFSAQFARGLKNYSSI